MLARVEHPLSEDTEGGHRPLERPRDHSAWFMGLRLALAVGIAAAVARWLGYATPSWAIITAAYISTNPPAESLRSGLGNVAAAGLGIAIGLLGAWGWSSGADIPVWHFMGLAFVAGIFASRHRAFVYTIVVGTVVALSAGGGGDDAWTTALDSAAMIAIAAMTAPLVVWTIEAARARWVR